jgi:hypothetical protein
MGFLVVIALLFIALALCNRFSPDDAKILRSIIKGFLIFIIVIFVLLILFILLAAISPFILKSLLF